MTKEAFKQALASLKEAGLVVEESEYNRQAFGSWYITVLAKPGCRIVWDGKEENLRVERKIGEFFNGLPLWDELWLSPNPDRDDFLNGIQELINKCNNYRMVFVPHCASVVGGCLRATPAGGSSPLAAGRGGVAFVPCHTTVWQHESVALHHL